MQKKCKKRSLFPKDQGSLFRKDQGSLFRKDHSLYELTALIKKTSRN